MKSRVKKAARQSPAWTDLSTLDVTKPLVWTSFFGREARVEIDLGAGDGDFILHRAAAMPDRDFLAVERLLGRALKIARRAQQRGISNVRVLRLESSYTLRYLVPPESLAALHLMFPDPWPKKRHERHRLVQSAFAADITHALEENGEFRLTTDHEAYFRDACEVMDGEPGLNRVALWDFGADAETDFQRLWKEEGRATFRARWIKERSDRQSAG